ncbi:hypothetical protein [Tepidamorphus gemmatus]|uniref:hypothetical protein n=1 Tax=Tepidamorphus gemmatus TaxID=747076 RepID=UPI0010476397|nr:hypothetical protein [Tepidamorphus gemmatus]
MSIRSIARPRFAWGDPRRWLAAALSLLLLAAAFDFGTAMAGPVRAIVTHETGLQPSGEDTVLPGRPQAEVRTGAPVQPASADDDRSPPALARSFGRQDRLAVVRLRTILGLDPDAALPDGVCPPDHPVRAPPV